MKTLFRSLVGLGLWIAIASSVGAVLNPNIIVYLEEPTTGRPYASVSNLRGWAVAPSGIARIEIFVDGEYVLDVPYGGLREDVGAAYPDSPNSDYSGFSMAYNYKSLSPGMHRMLARAYDTLGNYNDSESVFSADRFISPFITDPNSVNLLENISEIDVLDTKRFMFGPVEAEGRLWVVVLGWDNATQGFEIEFTAEVPNPLANPFVAGSRWLGLLASSGSGCFGTLELNVTTSSEDVFTANGSYVNTGGNSGSECPPTLSATFAGTYFQGVVYLEEPFGLDLIGKLNSSGDFVTGIWEDISTDDEEGVWDARKQ